jgi:hypothetical protein
LSVPETLGKSLNNFFLTLASFIRRQDYNRLVELVTRS